MDSNTLLSRQTWDFPIPIHYGCGVRHELVELCRATAIIAPLVVTDSGTAKLPFVAEILDQLKRGGLHPTLFSKVNSNPTQQNIADGVDVFIASGSDGVVALGGGSGMDTGKAISFIANAGAERIWDFDFLDFCATDINAADCYPLICIPTTAGTGAETDSGSIITDTSAAVKRCLYHPGHKPAMAILDPELTLGLPANLTAWTGADALVHAIETFVVPQFHPILDGIALQSMELIGQSLVQSVKHGDDINARAKMLTGSCLAGIAFMKGLGLVHSISHMIGGACNTHHGLTNAVLLPAVLKFNRPRIEHKVPAMCRAMGIQNNGKHACSFDEFYTAIVSLLDDIGIPDSLSALGVPENRLDMISKNTMFDLCLPTNPREVAVEDIQRLLHNAMQKAR